VATWTFESFGDETKVTIQMVFDTSADLELVIKEYGAIEGAKQTLGRLENHLETVSAQATAEQDLIFSRTFNAPRALVWKAWTDPEHVLQWWGPKGFNNSACEIDLRVGGTFHLTMQAPDGGSYPCKGIYREIVEPERIVFASEADESHPCGAGLPPRSLVTITFTEQGNKTMLTLHTCFETSARRDAANLAGYSVSWAEALDRLGEMWVKI
jgi:uncharacterized protein YndB with AHSA1/START domain